MVATMSRQFNVRASREGDWWFLEVDGVEGGFSQARRLDQVDRTIRDLLSLLLEIPSDDVDLRVHIDWPAGLREASGRARQAREEAEHAREAATIEMRRAAAAAVDAGFTVRDVAELLEVSPQQISSCASPSRRRGTGQVVRALKGRAADRGRSVEAASRDPEDAA